LPATSASSAAWTLTAIGFLAAACTAFASAACAAA